MNNNINYVEARQHVKDGKEVRRTSWEESRKIRLANTADHDYINYPDLDGVVVSDCPLKRCDCIICIYNPTQEDQSAEDWVILN